MKKISANENHNSDPSVELANTFWRWFSFSVFALLIAAAIPAFSADVFIDEGDNDFAATPVSAPPTPVAANVPAVGGKAPASEEIPPAGAGTDIDASIGELEPAPAMDVAPVISEMDKSNAEKVNDLMATPAAGKKHAKKASKASSKKSAKASKKSSKKVAKKADKKKKTTASKSKKKSKKTAEIRMTTKKKSTKVAGGKKSSKRKIASIGKFAGGQYVTSSRSCALESAPGAGDSNGVTKASRKLWVEDSGNTSYYKVYVKGGAAAYVARDCF